MLQFLGLIPSSEISWQTAVHALKLETGGFLHIHGNVDVNKTKKLNKTDNYKEEWVEWSNNVRDKIKELLRVRSDSNDWNVLVRHIEYVKSYGPRVDHLVLDLECRPKQNDL